jgi:hypothetical protein
LRDREELSAMRRTDVPDSLHTTDSR